MTEDAPKRTPRDKKTAPSESGPSTLSALITHLRDIQTDLAKLHQDIDETRKRWKAEQLEHSEEAAKRDRGEEEAAWHKKLADEKGVLEAERKELSGLRKTIDGFETQTEKAVKEAATALQKELNEKFESERKLHGQEDKSKEELVNVKIANLQTENGRLAKELAETKKALDESARQVKDIAIKVIEGKTPPSVV